MLLTVLKILALIVGFLLTLVVVLAMHLTAYDALIHHNPYIAGFMGFLSLFVDLLIVITAMED